MEQSDGVCIGSDTFDQAFTTATPSSSTLGFAEWVSIVALGLAILYSLVIFGLALFSATHGLDDIPAFQG